MKSPLPAAFLAIVFGVGASAAPGIAADEGSGQASSSRIKGATAITEIFGDGQKLIAVAIEYDKSIASSTFSPSTFCVEGRTVTKVYANKAAARTSQGVDGTFVLIELSPADEAALTIPARRQGGPPPAMPGAGAPDRAGPPRNTASTPRREAKALIRQLQDVTTTDGQRYGPSAGAIETDKRINLVVDDFLQLEFRDPDTGKVLMYNLYVPKGYDRKKSYPMVMFVHDASASAPEHDRTLIQGLGAVIWATPSEQAKHEAFVLAPQFEGVITTDDFRTSDMMDTTVKLINSLAAQYSIDRNWIYTTGQSLGCMLSLAMDVKYPDLFAASLLVAGQWDPQAMAGLKNRKWWIIVSEGDAKVFPGMNASLELMEKAGATISRARWDARASAAEQAENVKKLIAEGKDIKYVTYVKGTTLPPNQADAGRNEHMETWKVAYSIEGVRDWLFTQSKSPSPASSRR